MQAYQHSWSNDLFFVTDAQYGYWLTRFIDGRIDVHASIYTQRDAESFVANGVYRPIDLATLFRQLSIVSDATPR